MFKYELQIWDKFNDDLKVILSSIKEICLRSVSTELHWRILASLTSFAIAHSYSNDELLEFNHKDGNILSRVWNPDNIPEKSNVLSEFFNYNVVKNWWKYTFNEECPSYGDMDMSVHPHVKRDTRYDMMFSIWFLAGCKSGNIWLLPLVYLYCGANREVFANSRLMNNSPYKGSYRVSDMVYDITTALSNDAYIPLDIKDKLKVSYNLLMSALKQTSIDFFIIGKDMSTMAKIYECVDTGEDNADSMIDTLRSIAVSKGDASVMTDEEADYYERAVEYLKGVSYVDEDEIEGIIESAFISNGPKKGYDIICNLY